MQVRPKLSHNYINKYISDYDIYSYYIGSKFAINKVFNSPLREDKNPSFGIVESKDGHLLYHDFATGDKGNAITFVKEVLKLDTFKNALERIYEDLIVKGMKIPTKMQKPLKSKENAQKKDIGVKRRRWSQTDTNYWNQFGITQDTLKYFEVDPIEYFFLGDSVIWQYDKLNPMYVYKVYDKLKIYRPLAEKNKKWAGNITKNYVFGYKQLPKVGDLLIITKSLKDVMYLYELGYNAISPSSEGVLLPVKCVEDIKKRFKRIIILYDNDLAGVKAANSMREKFDIDNVLIPLEYEAKDLTDFHIKHGKESTKKLLKETLKLI